jgi:hypothetical protein
VSCADIIAFSVLVLIRTLIASATTYYDCQLVEIVPLMADSAYLRTAIVSSEDDNVVSSCHLV